MKVLGTATLAAEPERVWEALNDPAVLVRTIPGCQRLDEVGPDAYKMSILAGVASIKGLYDGEVRLSDQEPPMRFVLSASGAGAPGTVSTRVLVTLSAAGDGATQVSYDADAIVGGMIGGVGQRMLAGVARKTASEFFAAVDDVLNGRGTTAQPPAVEIGAPATAPTTWVVPAGAKAAGPPDFVAGMVVGALAALTGAVVGGLLGRRR